MDTIQTLAYAGLGLAKQTNDKLKAQFDELVEAGKKQTQKGKTLLVIFSKQLTQQKRTLKIKLLKAKTN